MPQYLKQISNFKFCLLIVLMEVLCAFQSFAKVITFLIILEMADYLLEQFTQQQIQKKHSLKHVSKTETALEYRAPNAE